MACNCGGTGVRETNGQMPVECECAVIRRIAGSMELHIRNAKLLPAHGDLEIVRKGVNKSYFIQSSKEDSKSIIKAIMLLNANRFIRVTSDRELKSVFVGDMSRKAMGEYAEVVYNSLEDLMKPPYLCVVILNELKYKNKAAAGLLEEALSYRLDRDMPTWVISYIDDPFGRGSAAFSDTVWELICSLDKVIIPRIVPLSAPAPDARGTITPMKSTLEPEPAESSAPRETKRKIQSIPDSDATVPKGIGAYGMGVKNKNTFGGRR